MPAKSKVIEAPYTTDGSLMHFPEDSRDYPDARQTDDGYVWGEPRIIRPDWRPNTPFAATLRLIETRRGRSAAYFIWHDEAGHEFPMFISDMLLLVQSGVAIASGAVSTRWMVTKRGANYGIRHAGPEEVGHA